MVSEYKEPETIGIDARYLDGGYSGIGNYSENLLQHLAQLESEKKFVVFVHSKFDRRLQLGPNFKVLHYPARPVSMKTLFDFSRVLKREGVELLHSLFPLAPVFYRGKRLVTVHDLQPFDDPEFTGRRSWILKKGYDYFYRVTYPAAIRRASWVVAVSNATRDALVRHFPEVEGKIIVVHEGLEASYLEPLKDPTIQLVLGRYALPEKYVLYVGSTRPNKNIPNMIRAFIAYCQREGAMGDLHFVMVLTKDRFFADAEKLIKRSGMESRFVFFERVTEEEKRVFYSRALALMFVTKTEGFGLPLLEAQASGTPVLAANHGALPEVAGGSAVLVNPDNPQTIASAMQRILEDEELRQRLIQAGHDNVKRFSWKTAAKRIHEIYSLLF